MNALFDRDKHISEISLNRLIAGESFDGKTDLEHHLNECGVCAERRDAVVAMDANFSILPPVVEVEEVAPVISLDSRRSQLPKIALAACALLAVGVFSLLETDSPGLGESAEQTRNIMPDVVRIKGSGFRMELFVSNENGAREVSTGETVHPGDRVGFKVANAKDGFLLIVGVDESGSVYPCYPQNSASSKFTGESIDGQDLRTAIKLDDVMGRERIIGAFCPTSFTLSDIAPQIKGSTIDGSPKNLLEGCTFEEVTLVKKPK